MKIKMYDGLQIGVCFDLPKDDTKLPDHVVFLKKKLKEAGYHSSITGFSGAPEAFSARMRRSGLDLLWNAFYSFNGSRKNNYLGPMMLDETRIPYSGSPSQAVLFCAQSSTTKQLLQDSKIPVVKRYLLGDPQLAQPCGGWLIRPLWDGEITKNTIIISAESNEDIQKAIVLNSLKEEHYAERFVSGRHFVVPVFESEKGIQPLVVGKYSDYETAEPPYNLRENGSMRVDHYATDNLIVAAMRDLAVKAAQAIGIVGYAHVRLVVTSEGHIYVTGIDPVPLINENSDYVTALQIAGIPLEEAIKTIISIAMARK